MPEIIEAGSIQLDKKAPQVVDAGSIQLDKPNGNEVSFRQGKDPSLLDRVLSTFQDKEKEGAKAVQALVDSEALGISPGDAYRYRDQIDAGVKMNPAAVRASRRTTLTDRVHQSFEIGKKQKEIGLLGAEYVMTGNPQWLDQMNKVGMPGEDETFISEGPVESAVRAAAKMLPIMVQIGKESVTGGLQAGMVAGGTVAVLGQAGPQIMTPEEVITVPVATAMGFTAGATAKAFHEALKMEAGLALSEIIRLKDELGNPIDPDIARAAAFGVGAINAGIEVAQIKLLLKTIPGLDKLLSKAVLEVATSKTVKEKLLKVAGSYAGTVAKETGQEVAQESTNIVFEELSKQLNNQIKGTDFDATTLADVVERLYQTAKESAQAFSVMAAPGNVVRAGMAAKKPGEKKPSVKEATEPAATPKDQMKQSGPFILGVNEDANGETTSFTMADPVTGETFDVPALKSEEKEIMTITPDMQAVNAKVKELRAIDQEDAAIDKLIQGEEDIEQVSNQTFGETEQLDDVPDFAEDAKPETVLDRVKQINDRIGEKGSVDLAPLVDLGRSIWAEGNQTFEAFTARAKELLSDVWAKVKDLIRQAWDTLNNERGSISLGDLAPVFNIMNDIKKRGGLNIDILLKQYPQETINELMKKRPGIATKKGTLQLDVVAEEFGMGDDELLNEMVGASTKKQLKSKVSTKKEVDITSDGKYDVVKKGYIPAESVNAYDLEKGDAVLINGQAYGVMGQSPDGKNLILRARGKSAEFKEPFNVSIDREIKVDGIKKRDITYEFKETLDLARKAYKSGNTVEVERLKQNLKWMATRKESIRNVGDYFKLTDTELFSITRKNPLLMDAAEFAQYLKDVELKAVLLAENKQAKIELMMLVESKRLKKVDNYRQSLELPTIDKMSTEQLKQFAKLLEPFQDDDIFLTQRELETVDRTDLKGIKTIREALERLAKEAGVDVEELNKVHVAALDQFRWDSSLRDRDAFFDILVTSMTEAKLGAELRAHNIETEAYELAKKSEGSRDLGIVGRLIPQDDLIMAFLEAPMDRKNAIAEQMTPEQINYAHFMQQYFADALNYLIATKSLERGRENYFVHIRRSFLENLKDNGIIKAFKEMFKTYQQDQMVFNILDDDTGNILPLEKFFQFSLQRTDTMDPTRNVTKAFLTYMRTFEKKKMFDAIIPKLDIYTQALTPTRYTPRGLEIDRSLKTFVNKWINNKKGRRLSFDSTLRQGGPIDVGIRALRTFTTMLDLGLSPIAQAAAVLGEQVTNATMLGTRGMAKGTARMTTDKGRRIIEKYRSFVGRSLWEELLAPGKEVTERISETLFAGFHASSVLANKQFLLASMSDQEFAAEEITPERLAEMQLDMGRFRVVQGTGSLVGSTSAGDAIMQYKKWAVPLARTLITDGETLIGNIKEGKPLDDRAKKELIRFAYLTGAVFIVGAMAGADDDEDKTYIGKAKARLYREAMTLTQGINPLLFIGVPRTWTWLIDTGKALKDMVLLEEYKTKDELKGPNELKKQFVPGVVRGAIKEE